MEKEIAQLDRKSSYQEGYRDGWNDALRMAGILIGDVIHRVDKKLVEEAQTAGEAKQ
jgi:hypothetical protein